MNKKLKDFIFGPTKEQKLLFTPTQRRKETTIKSGMILEKAFSWDDLEDAI